MKDNFTICYENLFLEMFLNQSFDIYFTDVDQPYNSNLQKDISNCIKDSSAFTKLFSKFQYLVRIKFNKNFLNNNKISSNIIQMEPSFLSVQSKNAISFHLTPEFYNTLPSNVQKFLLNKMLNCINFKKGEHNQFKLEHLRTEQLGGYYLFALLLLDKEEKNNEFRDEFFFRLFNDKSIVKLEKTLDFLQFLNDILYPTKRDYLFINYLTPQLAQNIMLKDNNSYNDILTPIFKLSEHAIDHFYEMYFTNLPLNQQYYTPLILNKPLTPEYIKDKFKVKIISSFDEIPNFEIPAAGTKCLTMSINQQISFNLDEILSIYGKYFCSNDLPHYLNAINARGSYDSEIIEICSQLDQRNKKLDIHLTYFISDKDNFQNVFDFSEKYEILTSIFLRNIIKGRLNLLSSDTAIYDITFAGVILEESILEFRHQELSSKLDKDNGVDYNKKRAKNKI